MDKAKIEKLLELIGEAVNSTGGQHDPGWKEKRDRVLAEASDDDRTNLHEFAGWFDADAEN